MLSVFSSKTGRWRGLLSVAFTFAFGFGVIATGALSTNAQAFSEDFAVVPVPGWTTQNNSVPVGSTTWFQGNSTVFPSQAGAPTAYIGANFNSTTGANTISNWLISPNRTFSNGDVITFYTRTVTAEQFPDNLQVRLSTAGTSTNVGTGSAAVGDFTTLLLEINPMLDLGVYPTVWTQFTITLSGLAGPTSGRIAFRYFVPQGGPNGANSDFIGIDTFSYTPGAPPVAADGPVDYNGDGRTDYVLVRNVGGGANGQINFFYNFSSGGATIAKAWGLASDFFVSGNWDTDALDDIAVWRPGAAGVASFYVLRSSDNTALVEPFGVTGDDPTVVEDYNGDGRTDFAVYRVGATASAQSTWFYKTVAGGATTFVPWGLGSDFPVPGDIDGNNSGDFTVQRPNGGAGNFWTRLSTGTTLPVVPFGLSNDTVVPGDYDGDSKTDLAVVRSSGGQFSWWYDPSATPAIDPVNVVFGASASDFPTQGDFDGDGKTDIGVWRASATANQSAFWWRSNAGAVTTFAFGANGDYPVNNFNTH